jgi:hypothetical protein
MVIQMLNVPSPLATHTSLSYDIHMSKSQDHLDTVALLPSKFWAVPYMKMIF